MKPKFDWHKSQGEWSYPIRVPLKQGDLAGASIIAHGHLWSTVTQAAVDSNEFIAVPHDIEGRAEWCEDFQDLICTFDDDGETLVAQREATDADRKRLRMPSFIQSEEWPMCCGRSMHFVGQIDDNDICTEPPPDAQLWWHDAASFYVFTCPNCLGCKAIGQQF